MKLRTDYHFHPNLPKNKVKAISKCRKIWKRYEDKKINCLVVTEHAYKNPEKAYKLIKETKPDGCFCFPGVECVTKEGVDIIVFSKDEEIYEYKELKTFKLPYEELVEFVSNSKDLFAFVTHPHTLGLTSVLNKLGKNSYKNSSNKLNAIEVSNGAFDNLFQLVNKFPFKLFTKKKRKKIKKTQDLPKEEYPKKIDFLAVGSDAHHVDEIGNFYEIEYHGKFNKEEIFNEIINNKGKGKICSDNISLNLMLLAKTGFTALSEFLRKTSIKLKIIK